VVLGFAIIVLDLKVTLNCCKELLPEHPIPEGMLRPLLEVGRRASAPARRTTEHTPRVLRIGLSYN